MADISNYLKTHSSLIEKHLETLVPEKNVPYNQLFQAARYSLMGPAKRIRPILALAVNEVLGGSMDHALSAACTLELIHTYSLIHDDLPSMDNDDLRRGKPSLHKTYPEGLAVLAGDFLLTHAFEILAHDPHLSSEKKVQLIRILSRSSGGDGMIAGQVLDIESEGKSIKLDLLELIHNKKTGALIIAAIEFGGILANATESQMTSLRHFGRDLGLAFQITDDILEVTSIEQKRGKTISSDVTNNKVTYITLLGIEKSKATAQQLYQSSLKALKDLPGDTTLLANLASCIINRNF